MFGPIAKAARAVATAATLRKIARAGDGQPRNRAANLGKFLHKKKEPPSVGLADQITALRQRGAFRYVSRGTSPR